MTIFSPRIRLVWIILLAGIAAAGSAFFLGVSRNPEAVAQRNLPPSGLTGGTEEPTIHDASRSPIDGGSISAQKDALPSGQISSAPGAIGSFAGIPLDLNPDVASVAQALRHPDPAAAYRLSTLVPAPPFDIPAYLDNPTSYAHEVIPSRAFQSAAPGPGVGVLFPLVPTQLTLTQSELAILRVHTQPFRPVSFLSLDAGQFGNALVAQTVIADSNGTGSVAFSAGSGTVDTVHILASSPVVSGQVRFTLWIHLHS